MNKTELVPGFLAPQASCSIASECLVNVHVSCMRNHDQIFVTYVEGGSRAIPIVVINDQWGELDLGR